MLDVRLPDGDGVEVCREIRSDHPEIQCLMLTSFADDEALFEAIMAGAAGYVLKQISGTDIVDAIRRVAAGESLLDPRSRHGCSSGCASRPEEDERLARLTPAGAPDPRPHRRGADEPPDRRAGSSPRRR